MRYRVQTPFTGLKSADGGQVRFMTLGAGTVIELVSQGNRSGLVDILYEGQILAAFLRDIEERAERLQDPSEGVDLAFHPRQ